jgi:dephospho-CoA kinase
MVVGITGNYCSGKSVACRVFEEYGFRIIDVDRLGHEALEVKKNEVIQAFGNGIIGGDGIDRKRLGRIVFKDPEKRRKLEAIVHPYMIKRVKSMVGDKTVINAALLIEMCLFVLCDFVIAIETRDEVSIERGKLRDGITGEEAAEILKAQIPIKEKLQYVDKIIENNGSIEEFKKMVRLIIEDLGLRS